MFGVEISDGPFRDGFHDALKMLASYYNGGLNLEFDV